MSAHVLTWLDEKAASFAIPTFTSEQEVVLGARLHLLGRGQQRAVAVQMLVFWPENEGFQGQLRGATTEDAFHHRWFPLEPAGIEYDESMDPIGPASFRLGSEAVPVDWSACGEAAGEHGTMPELEALGAIVAAHRDAMFLDAAEIAERLGGLPLVLTVDQWTHPDISGGEAPSSIADWQALAAILESGEPGTFEPAGAHNANDWRHWFRLLNG